MSFVLRLPALSLVVLALVCLASLPSFASASAGGSSIATSVRSDGRVHVALYIEAYCARCIDVVTHSLRDAMKRVGDIVDLEVVPFGNGAEKAGVVTCQHGERECHANTLQGCAQSYYPDVGTWLPFIICMEGRTDPLGAAQLCSRRHKIDFSKIEKCAQGEEGRKILYANARKTLDLQPPNKYVPWLTLNGRPYEDPENLVAAVCSQYTQPDKAQYCSDTHRYEPR